MLETPRRSDCPDLVLALESKKSAQRNKVSPTAINKRRKFEVAQTDDDLYVGLVLWYTLLDRFNVHSEIFGSASRLVEV